MSVKPRKNLKKGDLIILRSTVPVGTCSNIVLPKIERKTGLSGGNDFYLAFAPERTVEGRALKELRALPQIIGGINKKSVEMAGSLFREITTTIIEVSSLEAAEMVKLINNTYRDVRFGYANELALICDKYNLDTFKLIKAANEGYPRNKIPIPSPGVGGPCLTKDPYILKEVALKKDYDPKLIEKAREINEFMPKYVFQQIKKFCLKNKNDLSKIKIFIVGFAFKGRPETSDIRKSTTLDLLECLKEDGFKNLYGYDPVASHKEISSYGVRVVNLTDGFVNADVIVIMNNHPSYEKWDIYNYIKKMNNPALFFDTWHMFIPEKFKNIEGVKYRSLGNE